VSTPARPSIDVQGTLDDAEWLELYRESLRASPFWSWLLILAGLAVLAAVLAVVLGAPLPWAASGAVAALGLLTTYTLGFVWLGPMLRCRRVEVAERTAHWRIGAERFSTDRAGDRLDLRWQDVEQVRVTRRLVAFRLRGGRGVLGLPRRDAAGLAESLIVGWARAAGTKVSGAAPSRRHSE
jgi:hypothetical protein